MTGPMSTHHAKHISQPPVAEVERAVSCPICQAVYAPSLEHAHLLNASSAALESALMSMCHFCFRCRRPACPSCWDDVHGVCGMCVEETHLSFRTEPEPLSGLLLPPRQIPLAREYHTSSPLACIRPGRFQQLAPSLADKLPTGELPPPTARSRKAIPSRQVKAPGAPQVAPALDHTDIAELETRPGGRRRAARPIERALTMALFVILIVICALATAASLSVRANTLIAHILHIDIRAEIAYLLQLIEHLH